MGAITLPNFRTTADVTMNTRLKDGGVSIDWAGLTDIKAWLYSDVQKAIAGRCDVSINQADSTLLVCEYSANKPQYLGVNRLIVQAKYQGRTKTYDVPVFNFVSRTAAATGTVTIDEPTVDVEIVVEDVSSSILDAAILAALDAADKALAAKAAVEATEADVEEAEAARVAAESARVTAEAGRVAQAAADHAQAAQDHTLAGQDRTEVAEAISAAEAAVAAAVTAAEEAVNAAVSDAEDATAAATAAAGQADAKAALVQQRLDTADADHTRAGADHTQAGADHTLAGTDHATAAADHTQAGTDHSTAAADHTAAASDHTRAGQDHTQAAADHTQAGEDHTQAAADHAVMAGYDNRLSAVEGDVTELEAKVTDLESDFVEGELPETGHLAAYLPGSTIAAQANSRTAYFRAYSDRQYKISAKFTYTNTNWMAVGFFPGAVPPAVGDTVTVIHNFAGTESYELTYTPTEMGYIVIVENINGSVTGTNIKVESLIPPDYQGQIDSLGETLARTNVTLKEVKDAYQENNEIPVGGTMGGQASVSGKVFYHTATNYVNNYYPVVAHKECSIDVTATRTIATVGFVYFFAGSLPSTQQYTNIDEIIEPLVSGAYNIKYTPESDGYIFVLTSVSGSACCSGLTVKQQGDFIDFQSEINTANQRISLNEAKTEVLDEKVGELSAFTNKSDNYDARVAAYINANSGAFNAQDPSTNRFVRIYRARAGEKIRIYGNLSGGTNIYTFLAKSTKATIPVTGDTVQVLVAYPNPDIDQVIDVTEDCWYLIGFTGYWAENEEAGINWGFYRDDAIALKDSFALPKKIRAVVGDTIQMFKKSIFRGIDAETVDITTKCSVGRDFPRYFEYLPVSGDVGTKDFRILMKNYAGQIYDDKTIPLIVHATPSNPASMKRIAIFGDSLTQGGQFPVEVARRLLSNDVATETMPAGNGLTNLKFIGGMGDGNARYFGVGGWSWKSYATAGNPAFRFQVTGVTSIVKGAVYSNNGFQYTVMENNTTGGVGNILCSTSAATNVPSASGTLTKVSGNGDATITFTSAAADQQNPLWDADNEAVSFTRYLSNIGEDTVDCVVFLLGWNEMSPDKKDFSTMQGYMETVINALHEQYPSAIVKILGLQLPSLNGGLGTNYGANGGYADKFGIIKAVFNYNDFLQGFADDEDYSPFVEFVDVASQFDSENNMPEAEVQVNTRNSKTEFRGTNGVHPANPGYMQIADVLYRAIVHEYC